MSKTEVVINNYAFLLQFEDQNDRVQLARDIKEKNKYFKSIQDFIVCLNYCVNGRWLYHPADVVKSIYAERLAKVDEEDAKLFLNYLINKRELREVITVLKGTYKGKPCDENGTPIEYFPRAVGSNLPVYGPNTFPSRGPDRNTRKKWNELGYEVKNLEEVNAYYNQSGKKIPLYFRDNTYQKELLLAQEAEVNPAVNMKSLFKKLIKSGLFPIVRLPKNKSSDFYYSGVLAVEKMKGALKSNETVSKQYEFIKKTYEDFVSSNEIDSLDYYKNIYNQLLEEIRQVDLTFNPTNKFLAAWNYRFKKKLLLENVNFKWSWSDYTKTKFIKHKELFAGDIDYFVLFSKQALLKSKLEETKQNAEIKPISMGGSPVYPRWGENHSHFKCFQENDDIFCLLETGNVLATGKNEEIKVKIIPHKKTHVWKVEDDFIFMQRDADANVKVSKDYIKKLSLAECSIQFDRHTDPENFLKGNLDFKIQLVEKNEYNQDELFKFFATTFGESTAKTQYALKDSRFAFVDSGISPIFTISIYDFKTQKMANANAVHTCYKHDDNKNEQIAGYSYFVKTVQIGAENAELSPKITRLRASLSSLSRILAFYKNITTLNVQSRKRFLSEQDIRDCQGIPEKDFDQLSKEFKFEVFKKFVGQENEEAQINFLLGIDQQCIDDLLTAVKNSYQILNKKINSVKELRVKYKNKFDNSCLTYLMLIDELINFKKKLTYSNSLPINKGEIRKDNNSFSTWNEYRTNLADDSLKKASSCLQKVMLENKVNIVVLEDLEKFKTADVNQKGLNRLLKIWRHRGLKNTIEYTLKKFGITVCEIDARHTSQMIPDAYETERSNWGGREQYPFGDKTKLWTEDRLLNSDVAATGNMANRFFNRFKEVYYLKAFEKKHEDMIRYLVISTSKRVQSWLKRNIGSSYAVIQDGNLLPLTKGKYDAINSSKTKGVSDFYRHPNGWLGKIPHKEIQQNLIVEGRARGKVQSKDKASLANT